MEKTKSASFGKYLRTIRLEKGIKLSEVFRQTRISKVTLELIEAEDHARLPAEVFVIGFLRAYARVIGADGNVAVGGYLESLNRAGEGVRVKTDVAGSRSKSGKRVLTFLVFFAVIIAVAVFVMQATKPVKTDEQAKPIERTVPADVKEPADAIPNPVKPTEIKNKTELSQPAESVGVKQPEENDVSGPDAPAEAVAPETIETGVKQHISILVVEDTWLKVIVDSLITNEYSLEPGDTLELDADKGFNLLVGNANGIQLTFNGRAVPVPGKSGQVVTIQLP